MNILGSPKEIKEFKKFLRDNWPEYEVMMSRAEKVWGEVTSFNINFTRSVEEISPDESGFKRYRPGRESKVNIELGFRANEPQLTEDSPPIGADW
jgi:hypothetical protein